MESEVRVLGHSGFAVFVLPICDFSDAALAGACRPGRESGAFDLLPKNGFQPEMEVLEWFGQNWDLTGCS